jgi:hypothetical protein
VVEANELQSNFSINGISASMCFFKLIYDNSYILWRSYLHTVEGHPMTCNLADEFSLEGECKSYKLHGSPPPGSKIKLGMGSHSSEIVRAPRGVSHPGASIATALRGHASRASRRGRGHPSPSNI